MTKLILMLMDISLDQHPIEIQPNNNIDIIHNSVL